MTSLRRCATYAAASFPSMVTFTRWVFLSDGVSVSFVDIVVSSMVEVFHAATPLRMIRTSSGIHQNFFEPACAERHPESGLECRNVGPRGRGDDVFDNLKNQPVVPIEGAFNGISPATDSFRRLFRALSAHVLSQGLDIVVVPARSDTRHRLDDLRKEFLDSAGLIER